MVLGDRAGLPNGFFFEFYEIGSVTSASSCAGAMLR